MNLVSGNINHIFEGVFCRGVVKPECCRWNRRICRFPVAISSLRPIRSNAGINCTFRPDTVQDFCLHQQVWPEMTLNAWFNLKCALRTARLTYVCCGFRSWPCVTEWTWALIVSDKMWPMNCDFRAYKVCMNFRRFTAEGTNQSWALNLVIIHNMPLRCLEICGHLEYVLFWRLLTAF